MQTKAVDHFNNEKQSVNESEKKLSIEGEKDMMNKGNKASVSQDLKDQYQDYLTVIEEKLSVPAELVLKSVTENLKQNAKDVLLVRYTPEKINNNLFGEHFSVTIEKDTKKIVGFTDMNQNHVLTESKNLLSKEGTEKNAKQFLEQFDPGYVETLDNLWIGQHDETIILEGHELKVSGMKYKCYRPITDDYTWLIIGSDGRVITFEREIIWREGRVTEKWLHDSYLKEKL